MAEGKKTITPTKKGILVRILDLIEWMGNKLPDPAVLFLIGLLVTWGMSAWMSEMTFTEVKPGQTTPVKVTNMLTPDNFCLLYTSPSPRDQRGSRMPSSA